MLRVMVVILIMFMILFIVPVSAAPKDVTNSIKDKKKIVSLTKEFLQPAAVNLVGGVGMKSPIKAGKSRTFQFSKNADRRTILKFPRTGGVVKYDKNGRFTKRSLQKLSKQIFGKNTSKIVQNVVGDWGDQYPVLRNVKIYRASKVKYVVKADIYFHEILDTGGFQEEKEGTLSLKISRKNGAKCGYVATALTVKKKGWRVT